MKVCFVLGMLKLKIELMNKYNIFMVVCYFGCVVVVVSCGVEDECLYCCLWCGVCVSGRIDDEGLFWCWGLYLSSDIDDYVILWCWFC